MKFSMEQAWNEAVAMMSGNREVLGIVAGIFFFLPSLLTTMVGPDMNSMMGNISTPEQFEQLGEQMMGVYANFWWIFAIAMIAQFVGYLSLLALLRDDAKPTVGDAIMTGIKGVIPAFVTYVLFILGLSVLVGAMFALAAVTGVQAVAAIAVILLIPVALYVSVKVSLSAPVIAIDKVFNPLTVLARSWRLTKGNSLRLFLFFVLLLIVYVVIAMVLGLALGGLAAIAGDIGGKFIQGVLGGALGAVATVVMVSILASIHRQLSGPSVAAVSETFG